MRYDADVAKKPPEDLNALIRRTLPAGLPIRSWPGYLGVPMRTLVGAISGREGTPRAGTILLLARGLRVSEAVVRKAIEVTRARAAVASEA